jgi:hypothetical protein
MPRPRKYADPAERQRAYRQRLAAGRPASPTSELEQRLARCNANWVRVQTEVKHALAGPESMLAYKAALLRIARPPSD